MDPIWVEYGRAFEALRKKQAKTQFEQLWKNQKTTIRINGENRPCTCDEAFQAIRRMVAHHGVLRHPDFSAAQKPHDSGRPFELFVDASDFAWCGTLCQRLRPHGAPKIISMISRAFTPTQLRWSAMERELFGLWQSVIGHEKYIKGLLTYVYMDHKNNLFSQSMLDNRRIAKKVSNWALELQCFNIVRVWIRGEANILSDVPSRAPWENELAKHLPIPCDPILQLIEAFYQEDDALVERMPRIDNWQPLTTETPGLGTPKFGTSEASDDEGLTAVRRLVMTRDPVCANPAYTALTRDPAIMTYFGRIRTLRMTSYAYPSLTAEWPLWPHALSLDSDYTRILPLHCLPVRAIPTNAHDCPTEYRLHHNKWRGDTITIGWPKPVAFSEGQTRKKTWSSTLRITVVWNMLSCYVAIFRCSIPCTAGVHPLWLRAGGNKQTIRPMLAWHAPTTQVLGTSGM